MAVIDDIIILKTAVVELQEGYNNLQESYALLLMKLRQQGLTNTMISDLKESNSNDKIEREVFV